ncbi:MBL fold metallo-hydrolase [Zooshikella harenae]|uniref:MBL fold metallo-hydrolase n=1 Tax=Zooshikella harenae TaxID=2827238 RepID=UPI001E577709|nr:MBL fold metallo-hydrolase [Zooshikella harenae]
MMLKRILIGAAVLLASGVNANEQSTVQNDSPLNVQVYHADGNSFHVNSSLVTGAHEAMVIDAGFTRADAFRIAANVLDSGKTLKTIYVSQADPDYYFGVEVLKNIFPEAKVLASPAVLKQIKKKLPAKVAYWGPKLGVNAPQHPVVPTEFKGDKLYVDGHVLEIKGLTGAIAHRPYVWIPSIRAIVGNVAVSGGLHLWMADSQTKIEQDAWLKQLDEMKDLNPLLVVPGHMKAGTKMDVATIDYTRNYLVTFLRKAKHAKNSRELIHVMKNAYPEAELEIALTIGAKVIKGEMQW